MQTLRLQLVKQLVQHHTVNHQPLAGVFSPIASNVCTMRDKNLCSQEADGRLEWRVMFLVKMCRDCDPITIKASVSRCDSRRWWRWTRTQKTLNLTECLALSCWCHMCCMMRLVSSLSWELWLCQLSFTRLLSSTTGAAEVQPHDPGNIVFLLPPYEDNSVFLSHCIWLRQTAGTRQSCHDIGTAGVSWKVLQMLEVTHPSVSRGCILPTTGPLHMLSPLPGMPLPLSFFRFHRAHTKVCFSLNTLTVVQICA